MLFLDFSQYNNPPPPNLGGVTYAQMTLPYPGDPGRLPYNAEFRKQGQQGQCRVTLNPTANYAISEQDDPQSWVPLLGSVQQESNL